MGKKSGPPKKVPQPHGGALNVGGTPGNRGGTGRPSNAFRIRLGAIAKRFIESADSLEVAGNPQHKDWAKVGMWATEMVEGKASQSVQIGENPDSPILTPEERTARLKMLLG